VIEALETWSAIERTGEAGLPVRDLMFFADIAGGIPVLTRDFGSWRWISVSMSAKSPT
jgi:hypothetical protein